MNKELTWINNLRGICILFVYLAHAEHYWGGDTYLRRFYAPFYVNAFFVVSGYLLFRKIWFLETFAEWRISAKKQIVAIVCKIIVPTIFFSAILYLPKSIFNHEQFMLSKFAFNIFGGISFWFTSGLVIAQFCLLLMMILFHKRIWLYIVGACLSALAAILIKRIDPTPFPWFYKAGLCAVLYLVAGGIYFLEEQYFEKFKMKVLIVLLCGYCCYLFSGESINCAVMNANSSVIGYVLGIWSSLLIIYLTKTIKENSLLNYIGRNSITFYFLCGLFPALFAGILKRILPENFHISFAIVFIVLGAVSFAFLSSFLLNKFFPFLLDCRKIPVKLPVRKN